MPAQGDASPGRRLLGQVLRAQAPEQIMWTGFWVHQDVLCRVRCAHRLGFLVRTAHPTVTVLALFTTARVIARAPGMTPRDWRRPGGYADHAGCWRYRPGHGSGRPAHGPGRRPSAARP